MAIDIFSLTAAVIIGALLSVLIRKYNPEQSFLLTLCVSAVAFIAVVPSLVEVMKTINTVADTAGLADTEYLFKAVGICVTAQLGTKICTDFGQTSAAAALETAGKLAVVVISLPMIEQLVGIITELMNR